MTKAPHQYVYVIGAPGHPQKIGIATDPERRKASLQTASPHPLSVSVALLVEDGSAYQVEQHAHRLLRDRRLSGEWFDVTPAAAAEAVRAALDAVAKESPKIVSDATSAFRAWRLRLGWTQAKAAEELGLSVDAVKNYERGYRKGTGLRAGDPVEIPRMIELATMQLELENTAPSSSALAIT